MNATLHVARAVFRKDLLSLLPLVLLAALVQVLALAVEKLDILPLLTAFMPYIVWLADFALILSVFQLDAPASLIDDWLCRPVPKPALLIAKLGLILATLYMPRVLGTFLLDLYLGYTLPESLLEALLWADITALFVFPVFIMIAVVTSTLVQGMGALLGLFLVVFVIPTPLISPPGPLEPGIRDGLGAVGMGWLTTAPAKVALFAMLGLCLHAVFQRRNIAMSRIMLPAATAVTVLAAITPMYLLPWNTVYGIQRGVAGSAGESTVVETFTLNSEGACFPAVPVEQLNNDAMFAAASRALGVRSWSERQLQAAGSGGLGFVTRVAPRGLPRDWRAYANYVEATYRDGMGSSIALRPALYATDSGGNAFTHQWLLPEAELARLATAAEPSLELEYSITLLQPEFFELAADGTRRKLQGRLWCGATLEELNNRIVVDCLSAGVKPGLISAELLDIESSRVDATPPAYAPALVQLPTSRRIELELQSPSLLRKPAVRVTLWRNAGMLQTSVKRSGILGAELATCPLPSSQPAAPPALSNWSDESPHRTSYVTVDENVQLEVLDWGGTGTPLLLLPGLGATAHTWDTIAPKLAQEFRVFALSRRGTGSSSRPTFGYDTPTLARDVVRTLDALGLARAVIVGSSIAGDEMTWLGGNHPERISALIYLDAAYDRSREAPADLPNYNGMLPPAPPMLPDELLSYEALMGYFERTGTAPLPEGELIASYSFGNRYLAGMRDFDMRLLEAVAAAIERPRYSELKVPALALYATQVRWEDQIRPWYDRNDPRTMAAVRGSFEVSSKGQRESIEQFRSEAPDAEVVEIPKAAHLIFASHEAEVIAEIRRFVAAKIGTP